MAQIFALGQNKANIEELNENVKNIVSTLTKSKCAKPQPLSEQIKEIYEDLLKVSMNSELKKNVK